MKVPNNLLNGMGGKNRGVALFAVVTMALAGIGGLFWGLWAKFQSPDSACASDNLNMNRELGCTACGMG